MSTTETPAIGLPQRLWLALDKEGVSVKEMADYLGVTDGTVRNYLRGVERGGTAPTRGTLRAWAERCRVSFEWLADLPGHGTGWLTLDLESTAA